MALTQVSAWRFQRREACVSCGAPDRETLFDLPYTDPSLASFLCRYYSRIPPDRQAVALADGRYTVVRCRSCGLIYQVEVPADDEMAELYGQWLGFNDPLAPHQPHLPLDHYGYLAHEALVLLDWLRSRLPGAKRIEVLDFGAGWGQWAQVIRSFGANVTCAELSPAKVAHLTGLGFPVVSLDELSEQRFDFVNTEQVIEHLSDPQAILRSLVALLGPRAAIKISVPDAAGVTALLEAGRATGKPDWERLMPAHPLEHLNCFTSDTLDVFAGTQGLKRAAIPLSVAYRYPADWNGIGPIVRWVARPIKRFALRRGCYGLYSAAA